MHRIHPNSGEGNPRHKLKARQVLQIRQLHEKRDLSLAEIGEMFGVSRKTIAGICSGQTWKKVKSTYTFETPV